MVDLIVNRLDISDLINKYKGGGLSAFRPSMMLKVLFYGYLSNVYSCHKIVKALCENIHFMCIADNSTLDFQTINDFRGKVLKDHIQNLFSEVVEMGYVSLDVQYIDGAKIEYVSNRYTFLYGKVQ